MNEVSIDSRTPSTEQPVVVETIRDTTHALHRQRSHAADSMASARAAADVLDRSLRLMRDGAFDSITNQICDTSRGLEQSASTTVTSIKTAVDVLNEFAAMVSEFETSFAGLMELLARTRGSTSQIAQIAAQSNLLSLNARIEATRAAGGNATAGNAAGFRVVAVEISNLSKRTTSISDSISTDMAAIESALSKTASRFDQTKAGLARARSSIDGLEQCSQDIRDHSSRLTSVTHEVETMAGRQVELNELVERAQRHVEWVCGATGAIEQGIVRTTNALQQNARHIAPAFAQSSLDLERFEKEFARALVEDRPDSAQEIVAAVLRSVRDHDAILERLSIAAHDAGLMVVANEVEPPLETHYRNARILEDAIAQIEAAASQGQKPARDVDAPVVVLGNAFEDYHDLGRRLVSLALRADGVQVHDLGLSVPNERFVDEALRVDATVIGVSTLLLHTAKWIPLLRAELDRRGAQHVKVIAGGAIFHVDPRLCERFGANGVGRTPAEAVRLVRRYHAEAKRVKGGSR